VISGCCACQLAIYSIIHCYIEFIAFGLGLLWAWLLAGQLGDGRVLLILLFVARAVLCVYQGAEEKKKKSDVPTYLPFSAIF
jgi:hypothetical protein